MTGMALATCRLGLVGAGPWAQRAYLPNLARMDDVELAAVSTRNETNRRAAARWLDPGTRFVDDWRDLAEEDLDGLIIATPAETHAEIVVAALSMNLPVLCEKPLAPTLSQCDRILNAESESSAFVQVGLEFRHAPVLKQAAEWIQSGRLGKPLQPACHVFRDKRTSPVHRPERWVENGGVFVEFLCHYFDMLTVLSDGTPRRVSGTAGQHLGTGAWDHGWLNIEYDNEALGHVGFSLLCPVPAERLELFVVGSEGVLEVGIRRQTLHLTRTDGSQSHWQAPPAHHPSQPYPGSFEQIRHFVDCVCSGTPSPIDGAVGRQVLSLGYAAEHAVSSGVPVILE